VDNKCPAGPAACPAGPATLQPTTWGRTGLTAGPNALWCGVNNWNQPSERRTEAGDPEPRWDPRYLAFFTCFNRGWYFEAHEALEGLWLTRRSHPDGRFYQGLIQLAGAFVHVQKCRPSPALALLRGAQRHLSPYPATYQGLALSHVRADIVRWLGEVESGADVLTAPNPPRLELVQRIQLRPGTAAKASSPG